MYPESRASSETSYPLNNVLNYTNESRKQLTDVKLDHDLILCDDINCSDHKHRAAIDTLYYQFTNALKTAATHLSKSTPTQSYRQIPGWNDITAELHAKAREAFLLWQSNGKPK